MTTATATSLERLRRLVAQLDSRSHLSVDLENTLIPKGGRVDNPSLKQALQTLRTIPGVVEAVIITNRALTEQELSQIGGKVIHDAGKPSMRAHPGFTTDVVVGDQYGTDGLLAWRLGVPFIHWEISSCDLPLPTRAAEWLLRRTLLHRVFWIHDAE